MNDDIASDVERFRHGDPAAADALARRACRLALRTASAILHSREEAGDVAQDVAIDVLRSVSQLREPAAFDAWVHRMTVRHTLRRIRRGRAASGAETPLALLPERDEPSGDDPGDREALLAMRIALAAALADLPSRQRLAIALRYVHDLSDADIAAALNCRPGTVHALLSRGRAALRRNPGLGHLTLTATAGDAQ